MKSFHTRFALVVGIGLSLCGCIETPPIVDQPPEKGIVESLQSSEASIPLLRLKVLDRNFRFTIDRNGIPQLETLNENATLEDLMDFAKTTCWNSRILPKLSECDEISVDDALLASFVLDVENAVIQSISLALHDSVLGTTTILGSQNLSPDVKWEEYRRRENEFLRPLMAKFLEGNSLIRTNIRRFGVRFSMMNTFDKESVLQSIYRGDFAEDVRGAAARHPWYWPVTTTGQNMEKSEIEKSASNIEKEYKGYSDDWKIVRKLVVPYLHETWRTYRQFEDYYHNERLKDSSSRNCARIIWQDSVKSRDLMLENFCYHLYDLPFTILTHRSSAEYRDCKGFWNDDEDAMRQVASRFGDSVSGAEMLSHVESRYARDVYSDFVEELKGDLGDEIFKTVAHQARLKEFAERENERDAETGLRKNSTREFE